jgi:hypothetical protein
MVDAVLQAMTTRSGRCVAISSSNRVGDPLNQFRFGKRAVRKTRIVGNVGKIGIGPRRDDSAIDGEPAQPGIEDEDFRSRCHVPSAARHMPREGGRPQSRSEELLAPVRRRRER